MDPFLRGYVARGERFWLFLYPNTVTSLRHEWTHPAFKAFYNVPRVETERAASERWLRELAAEIGCTYDYLMDSIPRGRIHTGDREMYGLRSSEDVQRHYRNVTGESVGEVHFSCAC